MSEGAGFGSIASEPASRSLNALKLRTFDFYPLIVENGRIKTRMGRQGVFIADAATAKGRPK